MIVEWTYGEYAQLRRYYGPFDEVWTWSTEADLTAGGVLGEDIRGSGWDAITGSTWLMIRGSAWTVMR